MFVFKDISESHVEQNIVSYTHTFTTSSKGIQSIGIVSGSDNNKYWESLNVLYYTSGSPVYDDKEKFGKRINNFSYSLTNGTQFLNKFHGYPSSSLFQIPQRYYGGKIKEKTFEIVDYSFIDNNGNFPTIVDDGYGNLYSTNASSQNISLSSISSSDNYVGNIFYEQGIAVLTETSSWSGSVNYSDITRDTNFTIKFDTHSPITSHEYKVSLRPWEFNGTMNYSVRMPPSGSYNNITEYSASVMSNQWIGAEFTGSKFTPYITTINLYQIGDYDTPVITARLPKPIRKSSKVTTNFKIKLDM